MHRAAAQACRRLRQEKALHVFDRVVLRIGRDIDRPAAVAASLLDPQILHRANEAARSSPATPFAELGPFRDHVRQAVIVVLPRMSRNQSNPVHQMLEGLQLRQPGRRGAMAARADVSVAQDLIRGARSPEGRHRQESRGEMSAVRIARGMIGLPWHAKEAGEATGRGAIVRAIGAGADCRSESTLPKFCFAGCSPASLDASADTPISRSAESASPMSSPSRDGRDHPDNRATMPARDAEPATSVSAGHRSPAPAAAGATARRRRMFQSAQRLRVRVLGLRHGKQRVRRLRRTFEELVDRIAEHLRYLIFDQCAARAWIAKQRQHGRAPRRIRSRRVVELART